MEVPILNVKKCVNLNTCEKKIVKVHISVLVCNFFLFYKYCRRSYVGIATAVPNMVYYVTTKVFIVILYYIFQVFSSLTCYIIIIIVAVISISYFVMAKSVQSYTLWI